MKTIKHTHEKPTQPVPAIQTQAVADNPKLVTPTKLVDVNTAITPPHLVAQMLELAKIDSQCYVLEPSAGEGALVLELLKLRPAAITAVEIDAEKASRLAKQVRGEQVTVYPQDFLKAALKFGDFERVVMHPPQTDGQDTDHVLRALNLLASGGILVALMQPNDRRTAMRQALQQGYSEVIELQEKDKVLVRIQKP